MFLVCMNVSAQVSVNFLNPLPGSVVSNTININVDASSTAAQIVKVEIYRDGTLIKTINRPNFPTGLRIMRTIFRFNSRTNNAWSNFITI